MKFKLFAAALLSASAFAPVMGTVLYDNIPGFPAIAPTANGYCSPCGGNFQVFQPFTLGSAATIGHADFAITGYFASSTINISFWNQALDTQLASQSFDISSYSRDDTTLFNFGVSIIGAELTGVSLAAGNYFVSFTGAAGETFAIPGYAEGQQTYVQSFGLHDANPGADLDNFPFNQHGAFVLSTAASVPEPASWALMIGGFGLVGATLRGRRTLTAAA